MTNNVLDPEELPEILDMIRVLGDKYILLENGKPAFVLMGIEGYKKLTGLNKNKECCSGKKLIDKINQDIADWKMEQDEESEDYLKYIPEKFRPEKSNNKQESIEEGNDFVEDDLAYHYDVDENDEENCSEKYGENAPF